MKSNQSAEKLLRKNEIMKMPKKTIIILIMVIWVVTTLAMIIGGGYFAYRTHDFLATAESTQGEIIKLKESRSSKGGISYKPIYTFTDKEGRKHTIRSNVSSFPAIGNVGDKV